MTDEEIYRALDLDDSFVVVRTLAKGAGGETQLVRCVSGKGPASPAKAPVPGDSRRGAAPPTEVDVPTEPLPAEGAPLLVRKYIPLELSNRQAWEVVRDIRDPRLPHIRQIYDLPDRLAVVYDYIEGESLALRVVERGALPADEAIGVSIELCAALGILHDRGIVHRDVSPGNVILTPGGARLIDLGIARNHTEGAHHDTTRLGTWGFAAPEQYGFAQTDARSDVYSLGRLLGYMLTGVEPTDSAYEVLLGEADPRLLRIVERACAFEPSARYQGVGEMAGALGVVGRAVGRLTPGDSSSSAALCRADGLLRGQVPSHAGEPSHERGSRAAAGVARHLPEPASPFLACLREAHGWRRAVAVLLVAAGAAAGLLVLAVAASLALHPSRATDPFSALFALDLLACVELGAVYYPVTCLLPDAPDLSACPGHRESVRLRVFLAREARLLLAGFLVFVVLAVLAAVLVG